MKLEVEIEDSYVWARIAGKKDLHVSAEEECFEDVRGLLQGLVKQVDSQFNQRPDFVEVPVWL